MTVVSDENLKSQTAAPEKSKDVITTALRRKNPLGHYSSYTYNITLYMATPEAIAKFINSGKFERRGGGYYIVAQSGGISPAEPRLMTSSGKLGPGAGLDFYIDDLDFEILMPGGDKTPSVGTQLNFKIIEPIGFTLFTKLSQACALINQESDILKEGSKPNLFQQHYVIGIRFYGYDEAGNIITGKEFSRKEQSGYVDAETAITDDYASFERFFPIVMNKATYKLDGRTVTYNVEASSLNLQASFGVKRGMVKKQSTIVAGTVGEALQYDGKSSATSRGLMQILNEQELDEVSNKLINEPSKYSVEWNLKESIKTEKLNSDKEYQNQLAALPGIERTSDADVKAAASSQSIPTGKQLIPIAAGTSILSVIDNVITKSEYVSKALIAQNTSAIETATKKNETTLELNWFTVNPVVYPLKFDPKTNDWAYNITYQIQEYKVPYLRTLYKAKNTRYYGPHKEYNFFLTGKNTEVISYEQSYDNQFYIIAAMSTSNDVDTTANVGSVPVRPQVTSTGSPTMGKQNKGSEINTNVRANLFSVADQAMAKIRILGDPDYLMQNISAAPKFTSDNFKKMYGGDGFSINPYGGQIFVEIIFKLAEDYQDNGLLDVNNQIKFYSTFDATQSKIQGVVYRVAGVKNVFSRGQFTQELDLILIQDSQLNLDDKPNGIQAPRSEPGAINSSTDRTSKQIEEAKRAEQEGGWKYRTVLTDQQARDANKRVVGAPLNDIRQRETNKPNLANASSVFKLSSDNSSRPNYTITDTVPRYNPQNFYSVPVKIDTPNGPVVDEEGTFTKKDDKKSDTQSVSVNQRLTEAFSGGNKNLINQLRSKLGIPVGGTGGGRGG